MATWWRWGRVGTVAVAVALFAGAACADPEPDAASTTVDALTASDIDGWHPFAEPPQGWAITSPEVRSLRASTDDQTLVADVTVSPVRLADRTCGASSAYGQVTDEGSPDRIWAQLRVQVPNTIAYESELAVWADEYGHCPTLDTTLELEIGAPLAGRDVILDRVRWVVDSDGDYGQCEFPACDPDSGEEPVQADCEDKYSLVEDIRLYGDVGRHASIGESRCQEGWAMVEVDIGAGACPAGEAPNPCAGERIDRLFLRAGTPHWEVLTRTREAGCAEVHDVAPNYPAELCEDRPGL